VIDQSHAKPFIQNEFSATVKNILPDYIQLQTKQNLQVLYESNIIKINSSKQKTDHDYYFSFKNY